MSDIDTIRERHGSCDCEFHDCAAVQADADRLADHLRNAIHDLVEDWGDDGPLMRYVDAREALRQHDEAAKEASAESIVTAHTPPFDTVAKGDRP